jgi:phage I-like protein
LSFRKLIPLYYREEGTMDQVYGFWADATGITFDEDNVSWIHAMPVGEYEHPQYGKLDFTPERLKAFADSVKTKVRGIDLDIDYDHKAQDGKAAGWVRDAEIRADGLWTQVEWTKPAAEAIKNHEYKYFSPEFHDEWTDAKGKIHKNVLFGGGITNRPFLKDLTPVNLSELFRSDQPKEGSAVDGKLLRKALKLSEDATDEEVNAAVEAAAKADPPKPDDKPVDDKKEEPVAVGLSEEAIQGLTKALGEQAAPAAEALRVLNETVQKQDATLREQQDQLKTLSDAHRLTETEKAVRQLSETAEKKGRILPPAVATLLSEAVKDNDTTKFLEAVTKLSETGFAERGERGSQRRTEEEGGFSTKQFNEKIKEATKDGNKSLGEAVSDLLADPDAYDAYRQSVFEG